MGGRPFKLSLLPVVEVRAAQFDEERKSEAHVQCGEDHVVHHGLDLACLTGTSRPFPGISKISLKRVSFSENQLLQILQQLRQTEKPIRWTTMARRFPSKP